MEFKVWSGECGVWSVKCGVELVESKVWMVKCGEWRVWGVEQMPQSVTPATQKDRSTSSDTSRKTRFCGFPQRHANITLTTVAHTHSS